MDLQEDPIAIISSACRLPLGITSPSQLWDAFCHGTPKDTFTSLDSVPDSRCSGVRPFIDSEKVGGAGWLGKEGVESFDPAFFNITPAEAEILRPNARLALELTSEVLERAGVPPSSLRGANVAVSIGVGTEDGWDLHRFSDDGREAFDHRWAANSDPSGVSGQVSHFFDFRGPSSVISTACSSGAFALRDGIQALILEECEFALVGAVTTHFSAAPFDWAASMNVASKNGQCAAFSGEADGYLPSEGAVFFVLRRASAARANGNPILGIIRSLSTGHNGAARALATPNVSAQIALTHRSLRAARLSPSDVDFLEAHGTGTRLGDALEAEAFRSVYEGEQGRGEPLWVSSSKTLFGHCQAASMFVGILKVLSCFAHKSLPPHLVDPLQEFKKGQILIPTTLTPLPAERPSIVQVCSFGFTGSIASLILEGPPCTQPTLPDTVVQPLDSQSRLCILPFSAKTKRALDAQVKAVYEWACHTHCSVYDLGTILARYRDHYSVRMAVVVADIQQLRDISSQTYSPKFDDAHDDEISGPSASMFLNLSELPRSFSEEDRDTVETLVREGHILRAACFLYNNNHKLRFEEIYVTRNVLRLHSYLHTFPTYAFDRETCWRNVSRPSESPADESRERGLVHSRPFQSPSSALISESVASILRIPVDDVLPDSNIFELGIDSINSIELASTLSQAFGVPLPVLEMYSLLTVRAICNFFLGTSGGNLEQEGKENTSAEREKRFSKADVDAWVAEYGASLDTSLSPAFKDEGSPDAFSILLTGANGMLGCHLLHILLAKAEVVCVLCPVRGNAWDRLSEAYIRHGYEHSQLIRERDAGRLIVFHTSDLGDEYLGCEKDVYEKLVEDVDTVVHLGWRVDFNLAAPAFRNCIEGTRRLAQLCVDARKRATYYFISSFSAYFGYDGELIPEQPLTADLDTCSDQGYAISKLIAEHALFSLVRSSCSSKSSIFNLRVVRVGQICGSSKTADWSLSEGIPMMIQSLPTLKMLPRNMPHVSWIPSDICAATIADFVLSPILTPAGTDVQRVLHVANPKISPWPEVVEMIRVHANLDNIALVSLREYDGAVRSAASRSELPITRLLPYFASVIKKWGEFPSTYASLEVRESLAYSTTLASCPEVDEKLVMPMVKRLLGQIQGTSEPTPMTISLEPPILLFGFWSESVSSSAGDGGEVEERVRAAAARTRRQIQYQDENNSLDYQLVTLISQLSAFERVRQRGTVPRAVLGYCFGEYAASVCAGILSLETVVDIIVRRAAALHDVKGSMLSVFVELNEVKRQLLKLPFVLEVAIHAGPKHYVISGLPDQVASAQLAFEKAGMKTKLVETSIPFHSALMDQAIKTLQLPDVICSSGSCVFVSGLTGRAIDGKRLGRNYWLRHMRAPVLFVEAVRNVRKQFPESSLVDMGPGRMLSSIIARYGWDGCQVTTLERFLTGGPSSTISSSDAIKASSIKTAGASPEPSAPPPLQSANILPTEGNIIGREEAEAALANILVSNFGFKQSESQALLSKSFPTLGLQSLDFISFSEKVLNETGLVIPPSVFTSEVTFGEVLDMLMC